jgi:putative membrane protein
MPPANPYTRFPPERLSLNDHLAIDRTVLANERTLLAYLRTALALLVIGGTAIQFFGPAWTAAVGVPFVLAGIAMAGWGWRRFRRTRDMLRVVRA